MAGLWQSSCFPQGYMQWATLNRISLNGKMHAEGLSCISLYLALQMLQTGNGLYGETGHS